MYKTFPNLPELLKIIRLFSRKIKCFNNLSKYMKKIARGINQASALTNQHFAAVRLSCPHEPIRGRVGPRVTNQRAANSD